MNCLEETKLIEITTLTNQQLVALIKQSKSYTTTVEAAVNELLKRNKKLKAKLKEKATDYGEYCEKPLHR